MLALLSSACLASFLIVGENSACEKHFKKREREDEEERRVGGGGEESKRKKENAVCKGSEKMEMQSV